MTATVPPPSPVPPPPPTRSRPSRRTGTADPQGAGHDEAPDRPTLLAGNLTLPLAGMLATACASVTLQPLLDDLSWVLPTTVTVVVVVLTGLVVRQFTQLWPLAAGAQAAALAVVLTVLFARDVAVLGVLAGPEALRALAAGLAEGGEVIGQSAAPVPTTAGMSLLVALGVGVIALLVDLLAAGMQRPAAAGLPLLAVYCVPATVLPDGVSWLHFVLAGIGYLVLVSSDALERIRTWGQVLGGAPERSGLDVGPLRGGRRVAAVSLAVAVLLPMVTPGLDDQLLGQGDGSGEGRGSGRINVVNPIIGLRDNLRARSTVPVISYRTTVEAPAPLRIATDDEFDGEGWAPSTGQISRKQRVQDGLPPAPGLGEDVARSREETSISIGALSQTYLPLPYPTLLVEVDGDWLYEETSLNVVGDGQRTENTSYVAQHLSLAPTREQLDAAPAPPAEIREPFTELPDGLAPQVRTEARRVAGDGSDYQQALRLQVYLRDEGGFVYDEEAPGSDGDDSGSDAVLLFLEQKRGYCVHFASTMAVMARALGIPARVAVGFLPGTKDGDVYQISLRDAHAWPELYFEGIGWTRFEPTPSERVPQLPGYAEPVAPDPEQSAATPSASASAAPSAAASNQAERRQEQDDTIGAEEESPPWWQRIPWRAFAGLALLVLLGALPMLSARLYRALRWSRASSGQQAVETGWAQLRERLDDLGVRWVGSWTPRAAVHRLAEDHRLDEAGRTALGRLAGDVETTRYAPPGEVIARAVPEVRGDVDQVVAGVAVGRSAGDRRRATFFPRSGITAMGRLAVMPFQRLSGSGGRGSGGDAPLDSGSAAGPWSPGGTTDVMTVSSRNGQRSLE